MKINYISYLNPFYFSGGGELANREIIKQGIARGHEFSFTTVKTKQYNYSDESDLDFVVDIFNFPQTLKSLGAWRQMSKHVIGKTLKKGRFIHMSNAYVDICNLRYLPCNGESAKVCRFKEDSGVIDFLIRKETTRNCFSNNEIVRRLFVESIVNIYVSPLHRETINKALNLSDLDRSLIALPMIDTLKFKNLNLSRDIEYLFVGVLTEAKGFAEMRERFFSENIVLVGANPEKQKIDFGKYIGVLPYSEIPLLMNRAKNFVFLPRWPEPQGRVVIEAALSGCNLIINQNVGAATFPFDISKAENFEYSSVKFWEELERRI